MAAMKVGEIQEYKGWRILRRWDDGGVPSYLAAVPPGKAIEPCCGNNCGQCDGMHCLACWGMGLRSLKADIRAHMPLSNCSNCERVDPLRWWY